MFIVVTPGYPPYGHYVGTRVECLRYILKHGLRRHAWLEPF
jgi:hypothetical protein